MRSFKLILVITTIFFSCFAGRRAFSNQTTDAQAGPDTAMVFHVTDSIASCELKVYDEKSARQTGVPRMLVHYNKTIEYDEKNKLVFVYYSFSMKKFYGNDSVVYPMSTGFPDFISISYDLKTKKTCFLPEG